MATDLSDAENLQAQTSAVTTEVAVELAKPAYKRDDVAIMDAWNRVEEYRRPLKSALRHLSKELRAQSSLPKLSTRPLSSATKALRSRLQMWDGMAACVAAHVAAPIIPLQLKHEGNLSDPLLTLMYTHLHRLANPNPQSQSQEDAGSFADIPLPIQTFNLLALTAYRLLVARGRSQNARFLDVGCGGGTKLLAARQYFAKCEGLEYDPAYARSGRDTMRLLGATECLITEGNALTYENYGVFDVIYFYRPLKVDTTLAEMEKRIIERARRGTIILAPYDTHLNAHPDWLCARIMGPVFVTGVTQKEADQWHRDATRTAPGPIKRPCDYKFETGFWSPILDAAQFDS